MKNITLTEDERDVLQELMNVAYGASAAIIAEILDAFASLSIPNIKVMGTKELLEEFKKLKEDSYFFSTQSFIGEFSGESVFFIDNESAKNLANHLELEGEEDLEDAILEITNVLTSSLTTRLAQEINANIKFSTPNINNVLLAEIGENKTFKEYSQVIVMETEINFEDQKINAVIFILTKDDSIEWLKNQLNIILETLI